ncbi:hypothetical protein L2E82_31003 [Cichorium intybus]|uniref:Uncharacterized protein n=1 Tax=Cichorium intybus TaxID=13427 RepID=A0ACB9D1Z3_CICIN|nr:hypothetical protein L2E82_31003 [Cichorium intybus]
MILSHLSLSLLIPRSVEPYTAVINHRHHQSIGDFEISWPFDSRFISFYTQFTGLSSSNFQPSDRSYRSSATLNLSLKCSLELKALNVEPKRNDSIVPCAAMTFAPDMLEVVYIEKLAKDLDNSSPLAIMDKAIEKYGNDIARMLTNDRLQRNF